MRRRIAGLAAFGGHISTILATNWALRRWGIVSVGFGLWAPAGVYFAGLAFGLRDAVHELLGRAAVVAAISTGAACSYAIDARFALASALAFALSELADFAVYSRLRARRWATGVALSNVVGSIIDSAVFLWLAFGSINFIGGQVVAKAYMVAVSLPLVWTARRALSRDAIKPCHP